MRAIRSHAPLRRESLCAGPCCPGAGRGWGLAVNVTSGASGGGEQNENEKPQPIDNQLRFCFRVPRTIFENCNFIPFVNTLIFSCLWVYCKDNQYIVIVDKIV